MECGEQLLRGRANEKNASEVDHTLNILDESKRIKFLTNHESIGRKRARQSCLINFCSLAIFE